MEIGNNIKEIRETLGLTQQIMSDKLGIKVIDYQDIEKDKVDIKLSQLATLAEILCCRPVDILQYNDNSTGIRNYFYNHAGNSGININAQSVDQEQIRKIYRDIYQEQLSRIPKLEMLLNKHNISFDF